MEKKKPTPELTPEEILEKNITIRGLLYFGSYSCVGIPYENALKAMQEYADMYHKEKLRGELKAFNNFVLKLEAEGKIPLIDACIEDFIKTKK